MSELSFNIKGTQGFFQKLVEEIQEFQKDKTSSRVAINCAMTAWHLSDWTYSEFNSQLLAQYPILAHFQMDLKKLCPALQVMHDITNGAKHCTLTKHKSSIKESNLHIGSYSPTHYSKNYDITALQLKMHDGKMLYFEDELIKVAHFWNQYLHDTFALKLANICKD